MGITIASIATVSINKGMVGITGKTEGKMKVSSDASVILSASSKAECANFAGGGCKDKVEVVTLAADGQLISEMIQSWPLPRISLVLCQSPYFMALLRSAPW